MPRQVRRGSSRTVQPPATPRERNAVARTNTAREGAEDGFEPSPAELAGRIADRVRGWTSPRDERALLELLAPLAKSPERRACTFYELSLLDASLPDRLARQLSRRDALWPLLMGDAPPPRDGKERTALLRRRALELGSLDNPVVAAHARQRLASLSQPVEAFGRTFERLELPKTPVLGTFGQRSLEGSYRAYDKSKVSRILNRLLRVHDTESPEVVRKAAEAPPVTDENGRPRSFGQVTVLVNGLLNLIPTASMLFRIARHTDGPVILASSNPDGRDGYRLRELTEIWGTPVPPSLKGKLWAVGDLSATMVSWPQASDLLLEHLGVIDAGFDELKKVNPSLEGVSSLRAAKTAVIGYSQGALAAAATRKRLTDAGLGDVIDRLVSVAGNFGGTPFADGVDAPEDVAAGSTRPGVAARMAHVLKRILGQVDKYDGRRAFEANDPNFVRETCARLGLEPELVDLSYFARAPVTSGQKRTPKIEPVFGATAWMLERTFGRRSDSGTDGIIFDSDSYFGGERVLDEEAKTHLLIWKDPDTFDRILRALP